MEAPVGLDDEVAANHVAVASADEGAVAWIQAVRQKVWKRLRTWGQQWGSAQPQVDAPTINLTLSGEQAQSLAWSSVDGMAVIIRRPAEP